MLVPQAHLYPWLLPLHDLPSGEWHSLMRDLSLNTKINISPGCVLLLASPLSVQDMFSSLVSALYIKDSVGAGHILRYFDSRVLFHLHWMLTPFQLGSYLPVKKIPFWTLFLDDKWHTLAFTEKNNFSKVDNAIFPLAQLQRCGQINEVLTHLTPVENMKARQNTSRKIDSLLVQAAQCQLQSKEDQNAFALHGLRLPDRFWLVPKMKSFLEKASLAPDYYRDETSDWDEQTWLNMTCI